VSLTWARLTFRLARFEILAFGGLIVALAIVSVAAAAWIDSLKPPAACFAESATGNTSPACEFAFNAWYSAQSGVVGLAAGLLIFLSFAAGLFLGVPIVAREVERGTSRLAWSLTPSRMRWFLARMVPVLIVLAVLTFLAGVAADRFVAASTQDSDLSNSFTGFGFRGLLIASRAVFIFAVGVAVGAIVGRALPAIIFATIIATIGLSGGEAVHQRILRGEAVAIPFDPNANDGGSKPGDLNFGQQFILPDGTLVGYEYFGNDGNGPYNDDGTTKYPMVAMVVPGERYRFVETREAVVLAGGSLVALVLAGFVVSRRRPG
jgi:hypothetical protein